MKKMLGTARLQRWSAALIAGVLLFAAPVRAEQHLTLTAHVPPAVANGQTPLVGEPPGSERMSLAISLPLRNEADLDDLLQQIYDPQSPNYRQFLSVEEFCQAVRPGPGRS